MVKTGYLVGIFSFVFFVLCMFWGLVLSDPILKELHQNILRIVYPGFGFSAQGVLLAGVEAFVYGWFFGVLLAWLCKKMCIVDTVEVN